MHQPKLSAEAEKYSVPSAYWMAKVKKCLSSEWTPRWW
jgi:hypothetical protein